jgi:hypothetical protein
MPLHRLECWSWGWMIPLRDDGESRSRRVGYNRDPVRSSHTYVVKASGLRWLSLSLLVRIPWVGNVWALPLMTILCPSERYHTERDPNTGP